MDIAPVVTDDGRTLFTRSVRPDGPRRATLVLVHGYAEHSGRYAHVANTFAEIGIGTYLFDLRGHGRSDGSRAYVRDFDLYLDDLDRVFENIPARSSDGPTFLFGHSMGGLIALKYTLDRDPSIRGLVLSAPAIEINPNLAPLLRRLARLLGSVAPTLPTIRPPEGTISRDPEVVEDANNDPLNYHGRVKARTGAELLRAGASVRRRLEKLTTPFLVIHGTADALSSPEWSQRLYDRASAEDKMIHLYDGLYHETFNEPERETVLRDLQQWTAPRIP